MLTDEAVGMDDEPHPPSYHSPATPSIPLTPDTFNVHLNLEFTEGLSPDDLTALFLEFADWCPGPVLLQRGTAVKLSPCNIFEGMDCNHCDGEVVEHSGEDPHLVTVCVDFVNATPAGASVSAEKKTVKAFYSILECDGQKEAHELWMQQAIDALLSDSVAASAGSVAATIIGYSEFSSGNSTEREYWLSLDSTLPRPIKPGNVNSKSSFKMCVMHVQYARHVTTPSEAERVSIRATSSIELRAHQDKCRKCARCKLRADCTQCKGSYKVYENCYEHYNCHHCPEFKWQEVYGRQFRKSADLDKDLCHVAASILSPANACFQTHSLDDAQHTRFAFIVGNESYLKGSIFKPLKGVRKDASDIAEQLQDLGFRVHNNMPLFNQNKATLEREVEHWTRSLPENAEALIFLSGHGMMHSDPGPPPGEKHYFISVDCAARTQQEFAETVGDTCSSLEWIQKRVLDLALRHEGLLMSFWDCCSTYALAEYAPASEFANTMRSGGSAPLIRNSDKHNLKFKQKTMRSAAQVTVFGSASGTSSYEEKGRDAHQKREGGILVQALLAWWKDSDCVARNIHDPKIREFLDTRVTRGDMIEEQQEFRWVWNGGVTAFVFKQGVVSDAGNQQSQLQLEAEQRTLKVQQHEKLLIQTLAQVQSEFPEAFLELLLRTNHQVYTTDLCRTHEWTQNKRPHAGGEKGCPGDTSAAQTIETGIEADIFTAIFAAQFHLEEAATQNLSKQDVGAFLNELRYDPNIATVHAYNDSAFQGAQEGPLKIEREYWIKISRDSTATLQHNPGLAGKDGYAILYVRYDGEWKTNDSQTVFDQKRSSITHINICHTWDTSECLGERFRAPCQGVGRWRELRGESVLVADNGWDWRHGDPHADFVWTEHGRGTQQRETLSLCLQNILTKGENCKWVVRGGFIELAAEHLKAVQMNATKSTAEISSTQNPAELSSTQNPADTLEAEPGLAILQNSRVDTDLLPAPDSLPTKLTVMFIGANTDHHAQLQINEELRAMHKALIGRFGEDAWRERVEFKADLFADPGSMMRDIHGFEPSILHISCHGELGGLWLSGAQGLVESDAIVEALAAHNNEVENNRIQLVVTLACMSGPLACALSNCVDFVIGHGSFEVGDKAAMSFSETLYGALGRGKSLYNSFMSAKMVSAPFCLYAQRFNPKKFFLSVPPSKTGRQQEEYVPVEAEVVTFLKENGRKLIAEQLQSVLGLEEDLKYVVRLKLDGFEWLKDVPKEKLLDLIQRVIAAKYSDSSSHGGNGQELPSPANTRNDDFDSSYWSSADTSVDSDGEDASSVVIGTRNTGDCSDFQQHMRGFIQDFLSNACFDDVDSEWETFDIALGDGGSNNWTLCMLLWIEFAAKAFDPSLHEKWRKMCNNAPSQEILLSTFNVCLLDPATSPKQWCGDKFQGHECGKQYGACIFFTIKKVGQHLNSQNEAKQRWGDVVVNGWLSNDEPASEFLSRANTFLRQYSIDNMSIFEYVVKTTSYVAFMQMPSLAASLLFGYLEACKLELLSSVGAVGSCTSLHGFSSFVSSAGRVFRLTNADMPARNAVPTIVQGLRCLASFRDPKWDVKPAFGFLHADLLQVSAPMQARTLHIIPYIYICIYT